jgi:hypothetical protein
MLISNSPGRQAAKVSPASVVVAVSDVCIIAMLRKIAIGRLSIFWKIFGNKLYTTKNP